MFLQKSLVCNRRDGRNAIIECRASNCLTPSLSQPQVAPQQPAGSQSSVHHPDSYHPPVLLKSLGKPALPQAAAVYIPSSLNPPLPQLSAPPGLDPTSAFEMLKAQLEVIADCCASVRFFFGISLSLIENSGANTRRGKIAGFVAAAAAAARHIFCLMCLDIIVNPATSNCHMQQNHHASTGQLMMIQVNN